MLSDKKPMGIDQLNANLFMVSVHKYGFFLCREGTARILLGGKTYKISRNYLCIYTPNTFFQILERSHDLEGVLEEGAVDDYYPAVGSVDVRKRLQIRNSPCVEVSESQAESIASMVNISGIRDVYGMPETNNGVVMAVHEKFLRHLRYALCMKVFEVYFSNTPAPSMPSTREDAILNRFLMSVYDNCHSQRTVQYYADEQHLSPYYFSSIIRNRSGKSAIQWIGDITMTYSRQYLECSDMSIKEIAELLNFPDQSTFGRYFKHHQGCSPSEFRRGKLAQQVR